MRPTIKLGKIAGIEVGVHWSLLVIGALLVGALAGGELPSLAPHAHGSYLAAAVLAVFLFFASILALGRKNFFGRMRSTSRNISGINGLV